MNEFWNSEKKILNELTVLKVKDYWFKDKAEFSVFRKYMNSDHQKSSRPPLETKS